MFQFEMSVLLRFCAILFPLFGLVNCGGMSSGTVGASKGSTTGGPGIPQDLSTHEIMSKSRLVWFGAHPDDEIYASGMLKTFCSTPGKTCVLVTLTRGDAGVCQIVGGCLPNLSTVRSSELVSSANYMGVTSVRQYNLVDGSAATMAGVLNAWNAQAGTAANLTNFIQTEITNFAADVILTMDSRHGTSCNADHRAAGSVIAAGAAAAGFPSSSIYLVETMLNGAGGFKVATTQDSMIETYSISGLWNDLVHLMDLVYLSQYTNADVSAVSGAAAGGKVFSTLRLDQALAVDPRYDNLCP